jgi:hypothetical protein
MPLGGASRIAGWISASQSVPTAEAGIETFIAASWTAPPPPARGNAL